jgi:FkbM family methyltransferase
MPATRVVKALRLLGDPGHLRTFAKHRVVASLEHRALPETPFATVVDVGAHTGQFSLLARRLYPDATIHAFEPLPEAAERFRRVFADDPLVRLHEAAIAPTSGEVTLYVGRAWDGGSLLPPRVTGSVREVRVQAGPLEDFVAANEIRTPALLKLDVQGYEDEALVGCRNLLDRFDLVVAELMLLQDRPRHAMASDLIAQLRGEGFQLVGIDAIGHREGAIVRFDGIFSAADTARRDKTGP